MVKRYDLVWEGNPEESSDGSWCAWEDVEPLIAALAECYRLTGADPDGNEDWRLAEHAVEEVGRMRESWDGMAEALDRIHDIAENA